MARENGHLNGYVWRACVVVHHFHEFMERKSTNSRFGESTTFCTTTNSTTETHRANQTARVCDKGPGSFNICRRVQRLSGEVIASAVCSTPRQGRVQVWSQHYTRRPAGARYRPVHGTCSPELSEGAAHKEGAVHRRIRSRCGVSWGSI